MKAQPKAGHLLPDATHRGEIVHAPNVSLAGIGRRAVAPQSQIAVLLLVAVSCGAGCESGSQAERATAGAGPAEVRQDEHQSTHDFGVVAAGSTHSHVFNLRNSTGTALSFEAFEACTCTGLSIDKQNLLPGEAFQVSVDFQAAARDYDAVPAIVAQFRSSGGERRQLTLRLTAKVRRPMSANASGLTWSSIGVADLPPESFLICNYSGASWSGLSLSCSAPWLDLRAETDDADQDALQVWRCTAQPRSEMLHVGEHRAFVRVNAEGRNHGIELPVKISIQSLVVLSPNRVFHLRDADGKPGIVDLAMQFRTPLRPGSPADFKVSSRIGDAIRTEFVPAGDENWILRCHVSGKGSVIRDEIRVEIPLLGDTLLVPVFVSGNPSEAST